MTKCVATAVMRISGSSGRSRDTVWSMAASSCFKEPIQHICPLSTSRASYGWQTGANRVMLLSDDRNLPMSLQKTQISTISFGHSVGTGRTGVRPAPDVPRGCPPHSFFCARKDPRIHQPLTFLSQQSFGYCPRAKRSRSNTDAGVVGYLFETAHNAIAPMWQPGAYIRSCELSGVVERAHSNVARKTKGWLEHEIHHVAETREA